MNDYLFFKNIFQMSSLENLEISMNSISGKLHKSDYL